MSVFDLLCSFTAKFSSIVFVRKKKLGLRIYHWAELNDIVKGKIIGQSCEQNLFPKIAETILDNT